MNKEREIIIPCYLMLLHIKMARLGCYDAFISKSHIMPPIFDRQFFYRCSLICLCHAASFNRQNLSLPFQVACSVFTPSCNLRIFVHFRAYSLAL